MKIRNVLTAACFSTALLFAVTANAQDYQMQQQPAQVEVSDQQLQQFAEAQIQISEIQRDFSARLQDVDDAERAHELQVQANEEMTEAVEDAGLDVQSFNEIAMAIQNDPELQQRLTAMLHDGR
ncbi:MAG: DUF4168 domain-containing protein [Wenzhouxiangella sp.]|nr:DUF4168 domain-containing protein [Wenzhouxiangella sp.]MCH8478787.1 DUF4168 domain-containing protein [Wenzhouxiangella sp.]TVR98684.1 MAG: DUF4168 domain-containing protein [Wenzhouxiangellaceae bacterium]